MNKECCLRCLNIILCGLYVLLALAVKAQPVLPGHVVQTFGASNGLPSSEVLSLFQDSKDFIWFGTRDGMSRYDGYQFQNFEYTGGFRIGAVYDIDEDSKGVIWITSETGLYYWQDKNFSRFSFADEASCLPFLSIHFTMQKGTWLGTSDGPVNITNAANDGLFSLEKNILPGWQQVAEEDASDYISSSKESIVFASKHHAYVYQNLQLQKVFSYNGTTDVISKVYMDDNNAVYITTILNGFYRWQNNRLQSLASNDAFYFDISIKNKNIYVFTNAGIRLLNNNTQNLTTAVNIEAIEMSTPTTLLIDKEGNYWAATTEGVYHIKNNKFILHRDSRDLYTDVYSVLRRRNGELLIGTNRGLIFTGSDSLKPHPQFPKVVPLAEVFTMHEDDGGGIWFGTGYQGIAYYNKGRIKNFNTKNGLKDNTHNYFLTTSNGQLWTCGDGGVTRINKLPNDSFRFTSYFYKPSSGYIKLMRMIEAPGGILWAVGPQGIFRFKNDTLNQYIIAELETQRIAATCIIKDRNNNVWISTRGNGILQCSFNGDGLKLKKKWGQQDGLPSNTFLSLAFDKQQYLWAGTPNGVSAVSFNNDKLSSVKNFNAQDGFISKSYQTLYLFTDDDTMRACTSAGLVSFQPAQLLKQSRQARLYITKIDLLNTQKAAEDFFIKKAGDEHAYDFPNSINSFSIQFAALYYSNPEAIRYYYQLQGVDSGWTSAGKERTIIFRQLPPGEYKLLIKASIGGSNWTNTASVLFTINKAWWLQWWAIASAIMILFIAVLFYIRGRERKLKLREQVNTEIEKLRTASYQHQLEIEQVINYFATSLNEHTTVDNVLWDVARNCISRLGFDDCVIYLKNEQGDKLVQKAAWGPKTTEENKIVNPIEIPLGNGIVGTVAITGKAEKIDDTSKDKRYIIDDEARASEITVPIYDGDKVIGIIDSENSQKNFYTDRHLHILTTIASHCGAKISTLKAEEKTASAKMESLLNKQKALEASLQSMRLQMNPHFLFNALNSIQQMILSGEETTATRFLSKFSKLLRTVLTNSAREEVSLKEEIELLQLYVELESLRFKESFSYKIECDDNIDTEEVFVPALLMQPLVENAIWHGLMHKAGQRHLTIQFKDCGDNCILCGIEDNGVGRKASVLNGNTQQHTGKGLSVAIERLQALNEKNGTQNSLQVLDLKNEMGTAAGTRIQIILYHN